MVPAETTLQTTGRAGGQSFRRDHLSASVGFKIHFAALIFWACGPSDKQFSVLGSFRLGVLERIGR